MKKNVAFLLLFIIPLKNWSCSWYSPDLEYYNLFMQEIINDPEYYPFLRTDESSFYQTKNEENLHNENIEEWQQYLNINYEQAHYLVFEASRESIKGILNGEGTADPKLAFADAQFIKKHTQALRYISYAKYLAPYMTVVRQGGTTYWGEETQRHAGELDYDHVISVLKKSWNAETDKELKLRYGYQLVRFAHYNLKFQEALDYFDEYVEILDYKPVMYYYAVDQKGGAERALQNYIQANQDFFQFFIHTKNRKQSAYSSMRVTDGANFEELLQNAKTPKEKNDIYLLLGYNDFNNPLSSFDKIVAQSPNAVQAKVLMARAINQLERDYFPLTYYCPYDHEDCAKELDSRRLPITSDQETVAFLEQTLEASERQLQNSDLKDKDFWNLTSAYLYFIQKKYKEASTYLADVKRKSDKYLQQKKQTANAG